MTFHDPSPPASSAGPRDPEQLPLGMFEGTPLLPVEVYGPDEEVLVVPVREPPVCGEWSYDDEELEEPRFVAKRVDGISAPSTKATPVLPIRVVIDPRPAAARVAAHEPPLPDVVKPRVAGATAARETRPDPGAVRAAFEQSPGDTARAVAWANALEKKGDATAALAVLDQAEAAGAEEFAICCARASALGSKLRYADAEAMIKRAAKLRPDAADVLIQTGILSCRRARWREAIDPLQRAVALAPDHAAAHYHLGEALNHADQLHGALVAYERATVLEPDHWRALKGVGIVLDRLGRSSDAALFYRRAREAQRA